MNLGMINSYAGLDVVETVGAVVPDFSACRSPSRARRRYKRGIIGRVRLKPVSYQVGRTLFVHPVIMQQIREQVAAKAADLAVDFFKDLSFGQGGVVGGFASGGVVTPRKPYTVGDAAKEFIIPRGPFRYRDGI